MHPIVHLVARLVLVACLLSVSVRAADPASELDGFVEKGLAASGAPGLALGLVKGGRLAYAKGYGLANAEEKRAATPDTLFLLASVSKPVVAVAALQLVEAGKLDLDADINTYLPFPVRVPCAPTAPISTRMLLSHASSIKDNWTVLKGLYTEGDSPLPLGEYLKDYLVPGGKYYSRARNFLDAPPGTFSDYANEGVALAAYVVEVLAREPFDRYCVRSVFQPLGMKSTSWRLAGLDPATLAMPYNRRAPLGHYGFADYPAGTLRSSVRELSRFLLMSMQGGELEGARILKAASVESMRTPAFPALDPKQGLVWFWLDKDRLGHTGSERGVRTVLRFRPADGVGVIVLANGDQTDDTVTRLVETVEAKLFELSPAF